ncbi:spermidine/putrescine ABC transporter substrate-binding protein [Leucobacter sp. OH1287]|uniref:spermidine/putrescine ABC transporter substrate-binding protein n=1 Tax=Leucobacter sp. OH1287 TaxID=2491049 RepID=UPI001F3F68FA|nr:spermidine/putrescine ABC transporter substrate-binding protein [Leucobacter sp. OH1287]
MTAGGGAQLGPQQPDGGRGGSTWDPSSQVAKGVESWRRWVMGWKPEMHRTRSSLCKRCTGSPLVNAAGFTADTPHQVKHALVIRMHRIIDARVDDYTAKHLHTLHAELEGEKIWRQRGYDPHVNIAPELDGMDLDPEPESTAQPFLFTLAELADQSDAAPALPRPPLTAAEKQQLRAEIAVSDRVANEAGQAVCFELIRHSLEIRETVARFVQPQIEELLTRLSSQLSMPDSDG